MLEKSIMQKFLKKISLLSLILIVSATIAFAKIPDDIVNGLKTGNANLLSKSFNQNIELVVIDNENVYSKAHAKQVLTDFFRKYPPKGFKIIHDGGKGNSMYAIGNLETEKEKFRVYFLIKETQNKPLIHQLRIEKQNN